MFVCPVRRQITAAAAAAVAAPGSHRHRHRIIHPGDGWWWRAVREALGECCGRT